jgi:hypothetical protein
MDEITQSHPDGAGKCPVIEKSPYRTIRSLGARAFRDAAARMNTASLMVGTVHAAMPLSAIHRRECSTSRAGCCHSGHLPSRCMKKWPPSCRNPARPMPSLSPAKDLDIRSGSAGAFGVDQIPMTRSILRAKGSFVRAPARDRRGLRVKSADFGKNNEPNADCGLAA